MALEGTLTAVNVGLPREISWRGQTVRTAIWKAPVEGPVEVRRLNLDGDGQADLVGHGGEHRAVFVYQLESYRHWERELGRTLEPAGQFGENFTIEGLSDEEVCIGDRFAIGTALFEVTQPRVTCFKVGVRLDEPRMPALLTGQGRPGFYFRVIEEGVVTAGDAIRPVSRDPRALSVRRTSDLLYRPGGQDAEDLRRALSIPALSEGWRGSFESMLTGAEAGLGNVGLTAPAARPAWSGFRPFAVAQVAAEAMDIRSVLLTPADGGPLPPHAPGQFVAIRLREGEGSVVRSYSLSAAGDGRRLRITVKREGRVSGLVHALREGDLVELGAPRGSFSIDVDGDRPAVLISGGIGLTPVLAMLDALARAGSRRPTTWVHVTRSASQHAHRREAAELLARLPGGRAHVRYTRPGPEDAPDAVGRLTGEELAKLRIDPGSEAFVCGPTGFADQVIEGLLALGLSEQSIHSEAFDSSPTATPGSTPHPPAREPATGPAVSFVRSGLTVHWDEGLGTLLELAEACDVPVEWSCRTGVCHRCQSGLIDGEVAYDPPPLDDPAEGYVLVCCARPTGDLTLDL